MSTETKQGLILVIDGLPIETPEIHKERRGPRTNAPKKAVQGFFNSLGIAAEDA